MSSPKWMRGEDLFIVGIGLDCRGASQDQLYQFALTVCFGLRENVLEVSLGRVLRDPELVTDLLDRNAISQH